MEINSDLAGTKQSKAKIVLVIIAAILLYGLFAGIRANISILSAQISDFTGISYGEVSSAFSTLNLVLAFSVPVVGFLTLKIQNSYLMLTGAILCAIGFLGTACSTTTLQLILFIGIILGMGCSLLCFSIVYSASKPFVGKKLSSIFAGILLSTQGILGMISSHAISGLIDGFGLTLCLIVISVSALFLIPFALLFIKRKNKDHEAVEKHEKSLPAGFVLKKLATNPITYVLILGALAYGIGDGGFMNHSFQYIEDIFNTDKYSPFIVSIYTISILSGALIGGVIGGKSKNKMLACGVIFFVWAALNCLILVLVLNNSFGLSIPVLTIALTFITGLLINTTFVILVAIAVERVTPAASAPITAILECCMFAGYSIDSFLGGFLHDIFGNFDLIDFIANILAVSAGIALIIFMIKKSKKPEIIV